MIGCIKTQNINKKLHNLKTIHDRRYNIKHTYIYKEMNILQWKKGGKLLSLMAYMLREKQERGESLRNGKIFSCLQMRINPP